MSSNRPLSRPPAPRQPHKYGVPLSYTGARIDPLSYYDHYYHYHHYYDYYDHYHHQYYCYYYCYYHRYHYHCCCCHCLSYTGIDTQLVEYFVHRYRYPISWLMRVWYPISFAGRPIRPPTGGRQTPQSSAQRRRPYVYIYIERERDRYIDEIQIEREI